MRGKITLEIARALNISRDTRGCGVIVGLELSVKDIPVVERLVDAGDRPTSAISRAPLFAIACEKPEDYERTSHWTARELAEEVIKQGIVSSISSRHVEIEEGVQSQYWLNPPRFDELETSVRST